MEPRAIGSGHTLVFHFDNAVTSVAAATALDAALNSAGTATVTYAGNDAIVTLTNVADNKRLTVTLTGVNGTTSASTSLGFLVGDVNSSHVVTAADIAAITANQGKTLNTYTYIFDLNADGSITPADSLAAKSRAGLALP